MKQVLFFILILFAGAAQAQDYVYDVTPLPDSTYRLVITDQSSGEAPYPAKDYGVLTKAELQRTLYELAEEQYNAIGEARAYDFFLNVQATKALSALDNLNLNNYDQAVTNAIRSKFNGVYQYNVVGTPTNVEVIIENLSIKNKAGNELGTIAPKSRRFIAVTVGINSFDLYTTNNSLYVGRNAEGQVVTLNKISNLPIDEEGLRR
jgi:hypothetical protein